MSEKHIVVLLRNNIKNGTNVLNFDKYTVSINYRICSKGVTLHISPPQKKLIDHKKSISPYEPLSRCASCSNPLKIKKPNDTVKAISRKKSKLEKNALKKLSVQEVYNFSETPVNLIANFHHKPMVQIYPKPKEFPTVAVENVCKFINMDNRGDSINETRVFNCNSHKIMAAHGKDSKKSLSKSRSLLSDVGCVSRARDLRTCKSSVIVLRNKVEKLHKENLSLRRRLQLIRSI